MEHEQDKSLKVRTLSVRMKAEHPPFSRFLGDNCHDLRFNFLRKKHGQRLDLWNLQMERVIPELNEP